jgi:fibronectin type 3 domain-containing protein/regulation of enolase protein 1 (concanavalin A-like superfamily)
MKNLVLFTVIAAIIGLAVPSRAYVHPCIPNTIDELATIKANLDQQPWKQGFAILSADSHSQLTYAMQGPFANVSRTPDVNLNQWKSDMTAVYDLALMWYFTGNNAYAQKSHDILLSWANTQTSFSGQEMDLSLGDFAVCYAGGADILRGTWPGWTDADTTTIKNYFLTCHWPTSLAGNNTTGPANKGNLYLEAGIAIAAFCDDTARFNHVIDIYRTSPASGLTNTLPTGEMGETGRDAGHLYGGLLGMAFISEVAWKQGVDLYSELDNRLLACAEYYARNTLALDNPFVPFGTIDYTYYANAAGPYAANRAGLYLIQNAYKNRFGLPTPWTDRKLAQQSVDGGNFLYARTADFSTATPLAAVVRPAVSLASGGLTLTTLGNQTAGRSASYSNGVWTVTGLGNDVWNNTVDDCQFDYQAMTGDCAMVVRVTSSQAVSTSTKAGVMIRDNLSSTVSQRGWVGITNDNLMESYMNGWSDIWGGTNRQKRSQALTPGMPYWIKIERRGTMINTYSSQDGTSWAAQLSGYYPNLPSTVYIGLFVCSGTTTTTTATFDHVAFTGGAGGLVTTPNAPAALFAVGSGKAITVRWLPSFGATGYSLLRSTTSGSGYTTIASNLSASTTSYVDTAVSAGTTYYYVVQAKNSVGTSGNSPQFGDSLLPPPMVNLAFNGTATASSYASSIEVPGKAFDTDPGSKWYDSAAATGWLKYDFGANNAQIIKRYTISSADVATRDPQSWNFLGSNDGTNWTTLDSQSGQTFANRLQQNTYNIANTAAYRYYQLQITANNGATTLAIGELGLWSDTGRTIPDGRYRIVSHKSNKVIDVSGGSTAAGSQLVQSTYSGSDSQKWDIRWQGNGQYRATGAASADFIDNGGTSATGTKLAIQPRNSGTSQLWTIVPDSDRFFSVRSVNSGLATDVASGSTADGANIIQSNYGGGDTQLWMLSLAGTPPPTPTGLTATAASTSQINLSWTASSGANGYNVKRATASGGPYTTIATGVTATSYSDTGLDSSTTYYYIITAANAGGESGSSPEMGAIPLPALQTYLKLDEASGTSASDATGNGWTGTLVGGGTWVAGQSNNALNLSGASQYVTLPAGIVSKLGDFTISAWVKPTSLDTWARVFDFGSGTATTMMLTTKNGSNGKPRFAIKISNSAEQQIDGANPLPTGVWTHIAVTLSGSTGTLYVNGMASGSNSAMSFKPSGMGSTTQNYLGKSQYNDPYFNGTIDDFRIYTRALSAGEISLLAGGSLPAPQNVAAAPGNAQITLSWSAVNGATGYTIQRASSNAGPYTLMAAGVTDTSYIDSGLNDGATWYYIVAAQGLPGTGATSAPVAATTYTAIENWRFSHFGTTANSGSAADQADPDGDGMTNAQEFAAGTDPNDSSSTLAISQIARSGNDMVISFASMAGKTYRLDSSDAVQSGSWVTVQDGIIGTGGLVQIVDTGAAALPQRCYRVVVIQ